MKKFLSFVFLFLLLFGLFACEFELTPSSNNNNNNTQNPTNNGDNTGSNSGTSTGNNQGGNTYSNVKYEIKAPDYANYVCPSNKDELTYHDLFDLHNKVTISVEIDKSELDKLQEDNSRGEYHNPNKPEMYRDAKKVTITINDFVFEFEHVGIRQKGNMSRETILDNDGNLNLNHYKLSFDETFDDTSMYDNSYILAHRQPENKDREFLGLSGLDIKYDRNDDQTHLKEIYASYMYRAAGVISQNIGLSTFSIKTDNNKEKNFGLCYLFEPASKSLIKRALEVEDNNFINMSSWKDEKKGSYGVAGAKYGDLYKATYGRGNGYSTTPNMTIDVISGNKVGVKTDVWGERYPAYERKTNTGTIYQDDLFKSVIRIINNKGYDEIAKVVDLNYFAMEEAVSFFVGNPDSLRYNYNNYELYFRRTDGKMIIIPIDNDRAFGIGNTWEDGLRFVYSNDRKIYDKQTIQGDSRNPLFNKTLFASSSNACKTAYEKCIGLICESDWVKNNTFKAYFDILKDTYENCADFSLNSNGDNVSFEDFINKKIKNTPFSSNGNNGNNNDDDDKIYIGDKDNLYIVGTFNDWGRYPESELASYKLNSTDEENIYEVTVTFTSNYEWGNDIKIKFNNGYTNYNTNDYSIREENGKLYLNPNGSSYRIDAKIGDTYTIKVNVKTWEVTIVKK